MTASPESVARQYFQAINDRDVDAAVACWQTGGREVVHGVVDGPAPDTVRAFLSDLIEAIPDGRLELVALTTEDDRCAVQWSLHGTFGGPMNGYAPTGAHVSLVGCDILTVRDGAIVRNDAYNDTMTFARQAGIMPPAHSGADEAMRTLTNMRTVTRRRLAARNVEAVADGVWQLRGGMPGQIMNVYLIRDGNGVLVFDGGIKSMTAAVRAAAAQFGGITRTVLGHGHHDHRGVTAALRVPVFCHPAEVGLVEGDAGYCEYQIDRLRGPARYLLPRLLKRWDGGPVAVAGTLDEGDEIAGFRVVHLPGHTRGSIALWRESDGVALTSDCYYSISVETGLKCAPAVPHSAFTVDIEMARRSIRKLASLNPSVTLAGHGDALRGAVAEQLREAAER